MFQRRKPSTVSPSSPTQEDLKYTFNSHVAFFLNSMSVPTKVTVTLGDFSIDQGNINNVNCNFSDSTNFLTRRTRLVCLFMVL